MFRPRLALVALAFVLAHAGAACLDGPQDSTLNPQPLPPKRNEQESPTAGGEGSKADDEQLSGGDGGAAAPDAGDGGASDQ